MSQSGTRQHMSAHWRVSEIQVLEDYAIRVRFVDGLEGVIRFPPEFFLGVFSHLNDPAKFREAAVINGAVTWPGGLDLAPDAMYQDIKIQCDRFAGKAATIDTLGYRFDRNTANERTNDEGS